MLSCVAAERSAKTYSLHVDIYATQLHAVLLDTTAPLRASAPAGERVDAPSGRAQTAGSAAVVAAGQSAKESRLPKHVHRIYDTSDIYINLYIWTPT
jgi:hypothetical protein